MNRYYESIESSLSVVSHIKTLLMVAAVTTHPGERDDLTRMAMTHLTTALYKVKEAREHAGQI